MTRILENQIAVVTGAGAGIGKAIAKRLSLEGACVILADIDIQAAHNTAAEIGNGATSIYINVSDHDCVKDTFAKIEREYNRVDILVNNAGISEVVPFLDLDEKGWDKHLNVNLKGAFLCSQAVLKIMIKKRQGRIINISSQSGKKGNSQYEAYCASKFGIIGLTQSLAVEFAPYNININAVCPGVVWTPLWDKMAPQYAAKRNISVNQVKDYLADRIPLGRLCTPEDVAGLVCFLCSPDASYMTGQAINLTGGTIMH